MATKHGTTRMGSVAMSAQGTGAKLSIGALSRAAEISVETLRTWERRYGYPVPERKASGHRVYPLESVPRLRRIAQVLAGGHRAHEVVPASDADLAALLQSTATASPKRPLPLAADTAELVAAIRRFDVLGLTRPLLSEWARLGPLDFLRHLIAPLLHEVGDRWARGDLEIRHEHFVSDRIADLMGTVRLPFDERATGPLVVLATLPGEAHTLGLQMAALLIASAGRRVCYVGAEMPVPEIVSLVRDLRPAALGISVSAASKGRTTATRIAQLRTNIPAKTAIVVGGDGAPRAASGVHVLRDLESLQHWATRT